MQVSRCVQETHDNRLTSCIREDTELIAKFGKQKAFLTSDNSTCCQHTCQHYTLCKARCEEAGISENHRAIPWEIWHKMKKAKGVTGQVKQGTLDGVVQKDIQAPAFTQEGLHHAITQFVACDDQISYLVYFGGVLAMAYHLCVVVACSFQQVDISQLLGYNAT